MSDNRPTPAYLRHRAEALRAWSQQISDNDPEYSVQLADAATKLEAKAQELELESDRSQPRRGTS